MTITLSPIKKIHPELKPPKGSKAHGITPDNKQVYRLVQKRSRSVPQLDYEGEAEVKKLEASGDPNAEAMIAEVVRAHQIWEKNPLTGVPLYPRRKPELYDLERIFYLESDGQGNVMCIDYAPPTEKEIAEAARSAKAAEMQKGLAAALVDGGYSVSDVVDRLMGGPVDEVDEEELPEPQKKEVKYPKHVAQGKIWLLSDGARHDGTKEEAEAAEAALQVPVEEIAEPDRTEVEL